MSGVGHGHRQAMTTLTDEVESPTDLPARSWRYAVRRTWREFSADQCTDLAAALTYYAVLAVFPAMIALTSLLGLVNKGDDSVTTLLGIIDDLGGAAMVDSVRGPLLEITQSQQAGLAFFLGLGGALWSASGYVGAFGRAMNRIYEIQEGRPIWKLRPVMLLLTLVLVVLAAAVLLALVVTGPVADAVGEALGVGATLSLAWSIAKWPVIFLVVVLIVALLYYVTPNVQQPRFRWISVGALLAIVAGCVVSAAFGLYLANFSSYDKTYGALAGMIAFLLWLWLTNLALLFGAELDAELERSRELEVRAACRTCSSSSHPGTGAASTRPARRTRTTNGAAGRSGCGTADGTCRQTGGLTWHSPPSGRTVTARPNHRRRSPATGTSWWSVPGITGLTTALRRPRRAGGGSSSRRAKSAPAPRPQHREGEPPAGTQLLPDRRRHSTRSGALCRQRTPRAWRGLGRFCADHGVAYQRRPAYTYDDHPERRRTYASELTHSHRAGLKGAAWVDEAPSRSRSAGRSGCPISCQRIRSSCSTALAADARTHGADGRRRRPGPRGPRPRPGTRWRPSAGDAGRGDRRRRDQHADPRPGRVLRPGRAGPLLLPRVPHPRPAVDGMYLSADQPTRSLRDAPRDGDAASSSSAATATRPARRPPGAGTSTRCARGRGVLPRRRGDPCLVRPGLPAPTMRCRTPARCCPASAASWSRAATPSGDSPTASRPLSPCGRPDTRRQPALGVGVPALEHVTSSAGSPSGLADQRSASVLETTTRVSAGRLVGQSTTPAGVHAPRRRAALERRRGELATARCTDRGPGPDGVVL